MKRLQPSDVNVSVGLHLRLVDFSGIPSLLALQRTPFSLRPSVTAIVRAGVPRFARRLNSSTSSAVHGFRALSSYMLIFPSDIRFLLTRALPTW